MEGMPGYNGTDGIPGLPGEPGAHGKRGKRGQLLYTQKNMHMNEYSQKDPLKRRCLPFKPWKFGCFLKFLSSTQKKERGILSRFSYTAGFRETLRSPTE